MASDGGIKDRIRGWHVEGHSGRWSCRPLAGADEREEKKGCRVVVQGGGCCCRDCWRGKSGREKRYEQRGCFREA